MPAFICEFIQNRVHFNSSTWIVIRSKTTLPYKCISRYKPIFNDWVAYYQERKRNKSTVHKTCCRIIFQKMLNTTYSFTRTHTHTHSIKKKLNCHHYHGILTGHYTLYNRYLCVCTYFDAVLTPSSFGYCSL